LNERTLLRAGIIGTAITAVCCFTPVLVLLLAGVGLSTAIGWIDWIALPALGIFLAMTAYALWCRWRKR